MKLHASSRQAAHVTDKLSNVSYRSSSSQHKSLMIPQEMKISELAQRLADQERKTVQQLQPLLALKVPTDS